MAAVLQTFDYIVIGGGTSGLVVATRLTERPDVKVLVLEAGDSYIGDPRVSMPAGWPALLESEADWNFKTVPQVSSFPNKNSLHPVYSIYLRALERSARQRDRSPPRESIGRLECNQFWCLHHALQSRN